MAVNKIDPKVIFASEAPAQDTPAVFTNRTVGWGETRKNGGHPTIKQMNAEQQSTDLKILWLNENSVTPYDPTIDYPLDTVTIKDGIFKIFDGSVWEVFLDKTDIGLGNVDNTSDLNKPVSTATQTALDLKANKTYVDTSIPHNNLIDRNSSGAHASVAILNANGDTQQQINDRGGTTWYAKSGGYALNDRVILDNGDIVRSTVANNTVDPNVDMHGWVGIGNIIIVASINDLIAIQNPKNGQVADVKSYHFGLSKGGGLFDYDLSLSSVSDGVVVFNGWKRRLINNTLNPEMAGAKADYVDQTNKGTDDSVALQKVCDYFKENPSIIECDSLAKYYIANPIIVPDYTEIIGNGAQLFGNARTNACFYTGYYVNGVLTPLYDKPNNTKFLTNTKIRGFRYRYFKSSMKLRGMTQGCAVEDVRSRDCDQHLWSREHYFCSFRHSYADQCGVGAGLEVDSRTAVYDLWELNGMINIENIQCSSAPLAYLFYSLQATQITQLDAESCETAIRLRGDCENPEIHGCYFENCGVVLDVSNSNVYGGSFHNNFINGVSVVGIKGTSSNCSITEYDNRWRGTIAKKSTGSGTFRINAVSDSEIVPTSSSFPAKNTPAGTVTNLNDGYATSLGIQYQYVTAYDSTSGSAVVKTKSYMGSIVPFVYYGKIGTPVTNNIPFCSHVAGALQGDNTFSIRITTSIEFNEFAIGCFNFSINTPDTVRYVRGRFFGSDAIIDKQGFTLFTPVATIENVGGVFVIVLSGIKNTNNSTTYQARGFIRLV